MRRALYDNVQIIVNPIPVTAAATGKLTTGIVVDRMGKLSGVLAVGVGALAGSPTKAELKIEVTTCDTSDGTFAAADADHVVADDVIEREIAANTTVAVPLDLIGQKRYIKIVPTITCTGGTSASVAISGTALALGDADQTPVA